MKETSPAATDIGVAACLVAIAGGFIWDGWNLPPGSFEPLGPAPVPRAVALIVIGLSLVVMGSALGRRRSGAIPPPPPYVPRPLDAAAILGLTVLYVALMGLGLLRFSIATTAFVTLSILLLDRFRVRSLPLALGLGLILGFGLQYIFTKILVVDLP
jgi:hypothetical protein